MSVGKDIEYGVAGVLVILAALLVFLCFVMYGFGRASQVAVIKSSPKAAWNLYIESQAEQERQLKEIANK